MLVVMALIACLVVYLSMASGAVLHTKQTDKRLAGRQTMAAASSDILARVLSGDNPGEVRTDSGYTASVTLKSAGANDPVWGKLPGLRPLPGDQKLHIEWDGPQAQEVGEMYIVNLQNRRRGVIRIVDELLPPPRGEGTR